MRDIQQEPGTVLATKKVLASHQPCTAVANPVSAGGRVEKSTFFCYKIQQDMAPPHCSYE